MAKETDMSLFNDVLEPFRRVMNTDPPKDKLSAPLKLDFSGNKQTLKEGRKPSWSPSTEILISLKSKP